MSITLDLDIKHFISYWIYFNTLHEGNIGIIFPFKFPFVEHLCVNTDDVFDY